MSTPESQMAGEWPWVISDVLEATGGRLVHNNGHGIGNKTTFNGVSTDTRTMRAGELFVALAGEQFDGHRFVEDAIKKGAGGVVVNGSCLSELKRPSQKAGESACWIAAEDTLVALGNLGAFRRRQSHITVVAITGTNGKTTTKEMTAAVLAKRFSVLKTEGNFNNLIGLPLTLFRLREEHQWAVLELGMNHAGEIARLAEISNPQIGVITNVGEGHLEGVRDLDGVMRAKGELLEAMGPEDTAVLNRDDERLCHLAESFRGHVVHFGVERPAHIQALSVSQDPLQTSFDLQRADESIPVSLPIPGRGAVYNALAAAAVGFSAGLSIKEIKEGLENTPPMAGRMEVVPLPGGAHVINDTYNANPASMIQAIHTLRALKGTGRAFFVAGDMLELGDHAETAHRELGALAAREGIYCLFVTGDFAAKVADGAISSGMDAKNVFVGIKPDIVENLKPSLKPGDWVLVKGSRLMAMEEIVTGLMTDGSKTVKTESHGDVR